MVHRRAIDGCSSPRQRQPADAENAHDSTLSAAWRPLELDNIPLGVRDVNGRAFALGAVAPGDGARVNPVGLKMAPDFRFSEGLHPKTEVIHIATILARCAAAGTSRFAVDRRQIKQGPAGTKLNQAKGFLSSLDHAAKDLTVEAEHQVNNYSQNGN